MPNAVPTIVKITDPEAGAFKADVVDTVGGKNEREFDKVAKACNTERTTTGSIATDPHVLMLKRESDIQTVASADVPAMRTLTMDEYPLVPKPAPKTERDTDPLLGTTLGSTMRTAGIAASISKTNTCDDLDVNEATIPSLL